MVPAQNAYYKMGIVPALKDNGAATMVAIDCQGFDYCTCLVMIGVTDIATSVCKITECATTGGTYTDVTGLISGTSTTIDGATSTVPAADDDSKIWGFEIDLRNRERFLKINVTAGDGTAGVNMAGLAILTRADQGPTTAAGAGCEEICRV